MPNQNISVNVLDKAYQIKCPSDKVQDLQDAARYLDKKMREIRDSGKVVGLDRIAVIAGLNIAHTLLALEKKENKSMDMMYDRIIEMQKRIEEALTEHEQTGF